ncbi:hypothetical protein ACFWXA_04370 [Streptomyces atroolivaceus]|uniref:hypothetical protein n=1 Tax=Streptomyces atroolivaceus TaxID=66869 RepID=UPI00364E43EF
MRRATLFAGRAAVPGGAGHLASVYEHRAPVRVLIVTGGRPNRAGRGPSGSENRHTFGGLSGAAFRSEPLPEAGRSAGRPWNR